MDLTLLVNIATLATLMIGFAVALRKAGAKSQTILDSEAGLRRDSGALTAQIASLAKTVTDLTLITTRGEMTDSNHAAHLADIETRLRQIERSYRRKSDPMTDTP